MYEDHSFSAFTKFFKKLTFLNPRGNEMLVYLKILWTYQMNASWQSKSHSWRSSPFVLWDIVAVFCLHWPHQIARTSCRIVWRKKILVDCKTTSFQLTKNIYRCYLKLASAIFYQFFIFLPSDSPSNTVKNVFFLFSSSFPHFPDTRTFLELILTFQKTWPLA